MTQNSSSKKVTILTVGVIVLAVLVIFETFLLIRQCSTCPLKSRPQMMESQPAKDTVASMTSRMGRPVQDDYWNDPFSAMEQMHHRMNQLFNRAFTHTSLFSDPFLSQGGFDYSPTLNVKETAEHYVVECDLPGLEKDKISISVKGNYLNIHGVRETSSVNQDEKQGVYAQELRYGTFARTIPLPGNVDESGVEAKYENGVLTIKIPKAEDSGKTQNISIQ